MPAAAALPADPHPALVERRPGAGIGADPADRVALSVRGAVGLLAHERVPVAAELVEAHARKVPVDARLQHAAAAVVVAELPLQHARHVPAREVRVRREFSRPLREALEARVPLDALLVVRRVAGLRATRVRFAGDQALFWLGGGGGGGTTNGWSISSSSGGGCGDRAQEEEVVVVVVVMIMVIIMMMVFFFFGIGQKGRQ